MPATADRTYRRRPYGQNNMNTRHANEYLPVGGRRQIFAHNSGYQNVFGLYVSYVLLLMLVLSGLALVWISCLAYLREYEINIYNYAKDKRMDSTYRIMEKLVQDCERMRTVEVQFLAISDLKALASLAKKRLQPIQNIVTSLTAQTRQYEKMDRSKKPYQFVSTALNALDKCEQNLEYEFDVEIQGILRSDSALARQLIVDFKSMVEEGTFILDVIRDANLLRDNIVITPPPEVDLIDGGKYIDNLLIEHDFDDVLTIVGNLVLLLKQREEAWDELNLLKDKLGISTSKVDPDGMDRARAENPEEYKRLTEVVQVRTELIISAVKDYVKANGTFIQLLQPHHSIVGTRVAELVKNFYLNENKRRTGYLDLRTSLMTDINRLKLRIQRL